MLFHVRGWLEPADEGLDFFLCQLAVVVVEPVAPVCVVSGAVVTEAVHGLAVILLSKSKVLPSRAVMCAAVVLCVLSHAGHVFVIVLLVAMLWSVIESGR